MPHTRSAKKRLRQNLRRRARNQIRRTRIRTTTRKVLEAVSAKDLEKAEAALREAMSAIDKAAHRNVIHPNNAARKKARLSRIVESLREELKSTSKAS